MTTMRWEPAALSRPPYCRRCRRRHPVPYVHPGECVTCLRRPRDRSELWEYAGECKRCHERRLDALDAAVEERLAEEQAQDYPQVRAMLAAIKASDVREGVSR